LHGNDTDMPDSSESPLSADEICCAGQAHEKFPASEPGKQFVCRGHGWAEQVELVPIGSEPSGCSSRRSRDGER
jgi:hypothetical protein